MKARFSKIATIICLLPLLSAFVGTRAATLYVDAANTNALAPYSSWATAAVTIQDAVDAAVDGDEIVVTNGVYQTGARAVYGMSNRVAVTKPVTVRSVDGPAYTSIVGSGPIGDNAIRCAYLTNGAVLAGFTLTNGATKGSSNDWWNPNHSGGGAWCEGLDVVVSNCVFKGNSAASDAGGIFSGSLNNCTFMGNSAGWYGGGARDATLNNCTFTGNSAGWQGGATRDGTLNHCTLVGNSALGTSSGGGGAAGGTLNNCTLKGNTAIWHGGGATVCALNNCLIIGNSATGFGGGADNSLLNNCTVIGNSADSIGGAYYSRINNSILYHNNDNWSGANYDYDCDLNYCSTTPAPTSGVGNITNAPLFVDTNGWSNLRLQSNSPCINAGNNAYVTAATDLDGLPRIAGGTVDIGAYEFQSPASTISYAWLQQSGLPTDGSADAADTDQDGHNNWQEWMAGTDPTNALSELWLASPVITPTHVTLTWTSVTNRSYVVECNTNLSATPLFFPLATNLPGQPGTTTFNDTNAVGPIPRLYRVGVPVP